MLPVPDGDCLKLPGVALLPLPLRLRFQVKQFDTPKDLEDWIASCREHHKKEWSLERSQAQCVQTWAKQHRWPVSYQHRRAQVEGEGPAAKGMLTKFFSCADAWNARAVEATLFCACAPYEAAEEEEIRKLQLQDGLGRHLSSDQFLWHRRC